MDNAKYHRREALGFNTEENRKTLSTPNKPELIDRLIKINPASMRPNSTSAGNQTFIAWLDKLNTKFR